MKPGKLSKVNFNDYKPLREVIFNTIREAIVMGELKPGERLMEVQLAGKMGVSRTPVREAIRKLELEGLVEMLPRKGAHVAGLSMKDIIDVLEVRACLDGLASSLAASKAGEDDIKELNLILSQLSAHIEKDNLNGSIKKDVEFHDIIYRIAGNEKLNQIASNLREQVHRFRVIYLKDYGNQKGIIGEHQAIINAICSKNEEEASKMAQKHIQKQKETIIKSLSN